jgi:uncharacterized membrane protein YfcA
MIELTIFGIITGFIAGFFGVGGGMVLIPMLLFSGFDMKQSVSISVVQMIFSSIYGTFLNINKNKEILQDGTILGSGGFIGGILSGIIVSNLNANILQYIFILIVLFAIYRVSIISTNSTKLQNKTSHLKLLSIGVIVGAIAMSIGVGGSVMLIPILAGFLNYDLKYVSSLGLFFIMFSSIAGFLSLSYTGHMMYFEGIIVGIASLFGVYIGIYIKNKTNIHSYKRYILILYSIALISVLYKIFLP